MTVLDLTDIYMIVFLRAADAGRVVIGDEARVILDAVPDYVIPAKVSYVASESQFTPKTVETKDERAKLMFRVELRIDPQDLKRYYGRVEAGLRGAGFVLTSRDAKWPPELGVKLPPAPALQEPAPAAAPVARESAPAQGTTAAAAPATAPGPPPVTPSAPGAETSASASAPAAASPPAPAVAVTAASEPTKQEPTLAPGGQASNSAPVAEEPAQTPAPAPVAEASTPPVGQEPDEIAPANLAQLTGAWAQSAAQCDTLFQRRGKALAYRQPADQFAQAAIIESQRIRLPSATCRLERGSVVNGALKVSGECQDRISYTSRTVYLKLRSNNQLAYSPTGDAALETTLTRCPL